MGMLLYSLRNANGYYTQMGAAPLDGLKALLYSEGEYPPRMRDAVVRAFLWEAELSLTCGRKAAPKGDAHYATGSLFRTVCSWVQVPCALNGRYLMNGKGALGPMGGARAARRRRRLGSRRYTGSWVRGMRKRRISGPMRCMARSLGWPAACGPPPA